MGFNWFELGSPVLVKCASIEFDWDMRRYESAVIQTAPSWYSQEAPHCQIYKGVWGLWDAHGGCFHPQLSFASACCWGWQWGNANLKLMNLVDIQLEFSFGIWLLMFLSFFFSLYANDVNPLRYSIFDKSLWFKWLSSSCDVGIFRYCMQLKNHCTES